jgi:hypothetical protein
MARREYRPLYWCSAPIPGRRPIHVYLVSDEHDKFLAARNPGGEERWGCYDSGEWRINVWAGVPRAKLPNILLHEMMHAALDTVTIERRFHEENAVTTLGECGLAEALQQCGWSVPELPDGWRALASHARAVRRSCA